MSQSNEPDSVLSAWKSINRQLTANNEENDVLLITEPHSAALEELGLGLHLLQEFKTAQGNTQNNIFIEPLDLDSLVEDYICAIQELAEQAALSDNYGLQDACLLMEDALSQLPADEFDVTKSDLLFSLNKWSSSQNYPQDTNDESRKADDSILAEHHIGMLANLKLGLQLLQEAKTAQGDTPYSGFFIKPLHADSSTDDFIRSIQKLTEQAMLNDDYELQDACLLTEDALREVSADDFGMIKSDLLAAFNDWATFENSTEEPEQTEPLEPEIVQATEPEQHGEILENLKLGLRLLQEVKAAQTDSRFFIEPLHADSCPDDFIRSIQKLTEQAMLNDDYELQDACLLTEDALREVSADDFGMIKADLLTAFNDWVTTEKSQENTETEQLETTEVQLEVQEMEQHSETLENLKLGLRLLQEAKAAQTDSRLFIEPLHTDSSADDFILSIQKLTEQAMLNDDYELQDACLLTEEALREVSADDFGMIKVELLATFNDWASFENSLESTETEQLETTEVQLDVQEMEQHSETLENLKLGLRLLQEAKAAQTDSGIFIEPLHTDSSIEEFILAIQKLTEQAMLNDDYELQDACLLTEEALRELAVDDFDMIKADLLAAFNGWVTTEKSQENTETEQCEEMQATVQHSENLKNLRLGLCLLQEVKAAQNLSHVSIEPLQPDSSADDFIDGIQKLTEQAMLNDNYELQDACLLTEDALRELPADDFEIIKADLLSALNDWSLSAYPPQKLPEPPFINAKIDPQSLFNNLPEESSEHQTETAVDSEQAENATVVPDSTNQPLTTFTNHIASIEKFASEANNEGYTALHDVSQFIVDALRELSQSEELTAKSDLPALLDNWSTVIHNYKQNAPTAIDGIMTVLCHPDLNLPFEEDDFDLFTTLLLEDIAAKNALNVANVVDTIISDHAADTISIVDTADTMRPDHSVETVNAVDTTPASTAIDEELDNEPAQKLSDTALELVELLDTEAGLLNYRFLAVSLDEPVAERLEHLQQASEELERLTNASKMVGFEGLALACEQVNANIAIYLQNIDSLSADKHKLLTDWVSEVKAYLVVFSKKGAGKRLLTQMSLTSWAQPLPSAAIALLLPQMQVKGLSGDSDEEEKPEKIATDEDISLALPDDVNKELLDLLLQELPGYTQQFSEAIQRLQSGGSSKDIDVAQRVAHTVKGSANTVGIKGIAVLTHQIEDILTACAKAHKQPGPALINTLINASDCLEAMCESLLGFGEPPADAKATLQEVLDWAYQISKKGIQEVLNQDAPVKKASLVSASTEAPKSAVQDSRPQAQKDNKAESTESTQVAMVRVPTDQIENLFRLSGESIILNGQVYERQRRLKNQLLLIDTQFNLLQQLGAELERLIDLKDLSGRSLVNNNQDFDALEMDQYNELHTASRRMVEASVDAREISADMKKELEHMNEVLEYQQRLVINTQEAIMQTRFVPVGSISLRLQRGLRQTCRLTGKQGELTLIGENLLIDGDTLNALVEPLMHLLRNAIDHGLESEEERIAVGKPPVGQITIEFDREGNSILVRCRDDGRGLNFAAIRQIAEQRGEVIAGEAVDEEDLKRMILRPNFSTRTQTTQTSGRGVGMDVVNFQVLSLGGNLSLHSVQGQGLTVELRMPLPLSRSHALLANVCHYKVAISSKGVTQVLYSQVGELRTISHEEVLVIGEDVYPVVKLEDLLHVHDRRKEGNRRHGAVLLVQNENKITAVLVSSIHDSREVVIKSLGYYMKKIHGFVGATILGDGSVTPVLDIPELLRTPVHHTGANTYTSVTEAVDSGTRLPRVLVVDDSLSQRRALEQILTDAGFRVHTARDGIEAAEWLVHSKPDAVITDLEMPRMNGIELAAHIRTHANIRDLPIIMITSRSTQKHRQMAEEAGVDFYLIKPVQDDDLLTKIQTLMDKQHNTAVVA